VGEGEHAIPRRKKEEATPVFRRGRRTPLNYGIKLKKTCGNFPKRKKINFWWLNWRRRCLESKRSVGQKGKKKGSHCVDGKFPAGWGNRHPPDGKKKK